MIVGVGFSSSRICRSSANTLLPLKRLKKSILTALSIKPEVSFPIVKLKRCSNRMARKTRVGSSTKLKLCKTRIVFSLISFCPVKKSMRVPKFFSFNWMASVLIVKSLRNRSSLMELISTIGSAAGNL